MIGMSRKWKNTIDRSFTSRDVAEIENVWQD